MRIFFFISEISFKEYLNLYFPQRVIYHLPCKTDCYSRSNAPKLEASKNLIYLCKFQDCCHSIRLASRKQSTAIWTEDGNLKLANLSSVSFQIAHWYNTFQVSSSLSSISIWFKQAQICISCTSFLQISEISILRIYFTSDFPFSLLFVFRKAKSEIFSDI